MTAASPIQIDRLQTGRRAQVHSWLRAAAPRPVNVCNPLAVQGGFSPRQTKPSCTAILGASTSAPALARHIAPCSSVTPWPAPRQRHQVACAARRSGKTVYASAAQAASAGKIVYRTGETA